MRARRRDGSHAELTASITTAADGRDSKVAELVGVPAKVSPHGRFGYFAHYRGVKLATDAAAQLWFLEPDVAYIFHNDDGVTLLTCMPAKEKLPAFKQDLACNLERYFEDLPDASGTDVPSRLTMLRPNPSSRSGVRIAGPIGTANRKGGARFFIHNPYVPPMTVLIVDDHESFRSSARTLLEADGYRVVGEAGDGMSGLRAAAELMPDVVLLDVQLPDIDGFDVAARLATGEGPQVVLISSREFSLTDPVVRRSGARGFVPKDELSGEALAAVLR